MKKAGRPSSANRISRQQRINEIIRDLANGTSSPADLAAKYGISERQVRFDVNEALTQITNTRLPDAEKLQALLFTRLEEYQTIVNQQLQQGLQNGITTANLINLIETGRKINDQEAKLTGLYTMKVEVQQEVRHDFVVPVNQAAEMLALMEQRGLLPGQLQPPAIEGHYTELPTVTSPSNPSDTTCQPIPPPVPKTEPPTGPAS